MQILFQNHDAPVSDRMRRRAEQAVLNAARRARRPVDAVIRFREDGPSRRVELILHTSTGRRYVATSTARYFGTAIASAARRLTAQLTSDKVTPKTRARARNVVRRGAA